MAYGRKVAFEDLREVAFGGIGAGYTALGAATIDNARIVSWHNTTDVDIKITTDPSRDELKFAPGSGEVIDATANKIRDDGFLFDKSTIFYVKHDGIAPTRGSVWIHVIYAKGGV